MFSSPCFALHFSMVLVLMMGLPWGVREVVGIRMFQRCHEAVDQETKRSEGKSWESSFCLHTTCSLAPLSRSNPTPLNRLSYLVL